MFRRRKERREEEFEEDFEDDVQDEYDDDIEDEHDDTVDTDGAGAPSVTGDDAGAGPYDAVAPDDGLPRVDLGGMQVPVLEGLELRVEVDESGQVVAATLVDGDSLMQLGAFAAPKTSGIWADVRQ